MNRPPAFQTYANELLALTMGLSLEAVGAVHRLFLVMWGQSGDQCTILDDDPMLARTVGSTVEAWQQVRLEIQHPGRPIFEEKNGRLLSPYLRQEAAKQRKYRKSQSEKGKKSAEQRLTRGSTVVEPLHQPEGNSSVFPLQSSSPLPSSSSNNKETHLCANGFYSGEGWKEGFEKFWRAYPRKQHKADAEAWFKKHNPALELLNTMVATLTEFKQSDGWQKNTGQFVPLPLKWLEAKGWQDQVRIDLPRKEPKLCY